MNKYSYTSLETFAQCPYKFKEVYINGNRSEESTLSLEIGGLVHSIKELWANFLKNNNPPDINYLDYVLNNGIEYQEIVEINNIEIKNEITETWLGIKDLKNKYLESYMEKCDKTGMTYDEKIKIFWNNLITEFLDGWQIKGVEEQFQFVYNNRCILHGYIDRIDENEQGEIRVIDYKTSKDIYKNDKLATPLQMFIYGLACEHMYKKIPKVYIYEFVFLGKSQEACTPGYWNRGIKKLNRLLDKIEECAYKNEYPPKPSPLCYYCHLSANTCVKDKKLNGLCEYYSLWTPNNRVFVVNKKWNDFNDKIKEQKTVKKEFVW